MASEHGPFASEAEVRATRAAAALRAACDANPGAWKAEHLRVMTDACEAAGVELGAFDLAPFRQLALYEPFNAVVLAAVIRRVYEAGKAAGPDGAVTEWGVQFNAPPGRGRNVFQAYDSEGDARGQAAVTPEVDGWSATLMHRQAGPWTPVPGEGSGNA